jgi:magnesium-protoporphyrin O-methyltransferase
VESLSYLERRGEIARYFDVTAADAWSQLTSDAPVGRIRASVRAGRERMRQTLLCWLPDDLAGQRVLDAGCGTGALAAALARRGAHVVAVDLSPTLVALARERHNTAGLTGTIDFRSGDMLAPELGEFDYAVAMDSLIHYRRRDAAGALGRLAPRVRRGVLATFVPFSPLLAVKRAVGRCFPRSDRAPDVWPQRYRPLQVAVLQAMGPAHWQVVRRERITSGFYTSEALLVEHR